MNSSDTHELAKATPPFGDPFDIFEPVCQSNKDGETLYCLPDIDKDGDLKHGKAQCYTKEGFEGKWGTYIQKSLEALHTRLGNMAFTLTDCAKDLEAMKANAERLSNICTEPQNPTNKNHPTSASNTDSGSKMSAVRLFHRVELDEDKLKKCLSEVKEVFETGCALGFRGGNGVEWETSRRIVMSWRKWHQHLLLAQMSSGRQAISTRKQQAFTKTSQTILARKTPVMMTA